MYAAPWRAALYEFWGSLTESRASARALAVADLRPGEAVLEVPVGTGAFFAKLAGREGLQRCVGVELASPMLERARRRLIRQRRGHTALCRGDARRLPLAGAAFDLVVCFYMLDLFSEEGIRETLKEFRRVLKPGGRVAILVMAKQNWLIQSIWMALYSLSPALVGGCRPVPISRFLTAEGWRIELAEKVSQAGFRSELWLARPA